MLDVACDREIAAPPRISRPEPKFPTIIKLKGRGYVLRSDLDRYKAELLASALGVSPVYPPAPKPDPLIPLPAVSLELGVGRRTVGRRLKARSSEAA